MFDDLNALLANLSGNFFSDSASVRLLISGDNKFSA